MYGASWYIDPYNFNFPISMNVGDSIELTVKVDFITSIPQTGLVVDSMDIITDYKGHGFPIHLNDSLIVGLPPDIIPEKNDMMKLYPNPFSSSLTIELDIEQTSPVHLEIVDLDNNLIAILLDNMILNKGVQEVLWDGTDMYGMKVAKGMYIIKFRQQELELVNKVILN
jgi:hypothetical protein